MLFNVPRDGLLGFLVCHGPKRLHIALYASQPTLDRCQHVPGLNRVQGRLTGERSFRWHMANISCCREAKTGKDALYQTKWKSEWTRSEPGKPSFRGDRSRDDGGRRCSRFECIAQTDLAGTTVHGFHNRVIALLVPAATILDGHGYFRRHSGIILASSLLFYCRRSHSFGQRIVAAVQALTHCRNGIRPGIVSAGFTSGLFFSHLVS